MNDSIIVYKSRYDKEWDEYMYNHPEDFLWSIGIAISVFIIAIIAKVIFNRMKNRNNGFKPYKKMVEKSKWFK